MDRSELQKLDRRILDRLLAERRVTQDEVDKALAKLPDSAQATEERSAEELERFLEELEREQGLRAERIERALERASQPRQAPTRGPVEPIDEADL